MSEDVKQCQGTSDPDCSLKQYVPVPVKGEFFVKNGKLIPVVESKYHNDAYLCDLDRYEIWVQPEEDDE